MKCVVTGGAGFIGSHLAEALLSEGHEVLVVDDLSSGRKGNVPPGAAFQKKNILSGISSALRGSNAVFHLAADPDVRASMSDPGRSFRLNAEGTLRLLEECRKADVQKVCFASTSTVYGNALVIPTQEGHPCRPVSNYGASKLAGEAYVSAYSESYGIRGVSLRLANIYGERSTHGVICDFYSKLAKNPSELEILGDGNQDKSYLYVSDCVSAFLCAMRNPRQGFEALNVGSREKHTVREIAGIVCRHMGASPKFAFTGTGIGWAGDVPLMLLDVGKLESMGWRQKVSFNDGIKRYLDWLKMEGMA